MQTKLAQLKAAYAAGDTTGALRIAAKFQNLGKHKEAIERGWAAYQSPDVYREMGEDPTLLVRLGIAAVKKRYGL